MSRRTPISISLNVQELARLDDFATHHHINRSEAVRLLLMHARLPGQTRLPIDDIAAALVIDEEHAEPMAPVHGKGCEAHHAARKDWGRSNPFAKNPCRVCWPRLPTRDEADRAHALWKTGVLGPMPQGIATIASTPGWAVWAHVELDMAVGTPLLKGEGPAHQSE